MPPVAVFIATAIKGLMAERGVTQTAMASRLGRTQGYVSERVNGVDAFNTTELEEIAHILGFGDAFSLLAEIQKRR